MIGYIRVSTQVHTGDMFNTVYLTDVALSFYI